MNQKSNRIVKRIRVALQPWGDAITEKRMLGGFCSLYKGKMCVGETKHRLMVRVLPEFMEIFFANTYVKPMDFAGNPMKEFIFVSEEGYDTEERLQYWIELGIAHAKTKASS